MLTDNPIHNKKDIQDLALLRSQCRRLTINNRRLKQKLEEVDGPWAQALVALAEASPAWE